MATGSTSKEICAFSKFLIIWNKYLPQISIRSPSLDTCLKCHIFHNQSKYKDLVVFIGNRNDVTENGNGVKDNDGLITDLERIIDTRLENLAFKFFLLKECFYFI